LKRKKKVAKKGGLIVYTKKAGKRKRDQFVPYPSMTL